MCDVVMYFPYFLVAALTFVAAAIGIALLYLTNAAMGLRLGRPVKGIAMLVMPGVALPVLACLLSAGLAAWATVACAAVALGLLSRS